MKSDKNDLGIVLTVLLGIGLYVSVKKIAKVSKQIYRHYFAPAK
jgi:hypothetical protein